MNSSEKQQLLIVGQTPPPWHGQAVATKMLLDHEWPTWETDSVRMAYSDGIDTVGKFQWRKISHLFELTREVRRKLKETPETVMLYPPASASWLPFLRDVYFLRRTRPLARGTAFIFHASGLPSFTQGSWLKRWLAKLAYHQPDLSLEVAREKVTAKEVFQARESVWCPCAAEVPELPPRQSREGKRFTALFVGSLMEGKGIKEILRTAKVMKNRADELICFAIVGRWSSAEFQATCEDYVLKHELGDWIDFRGQLTGDAKWEAFQTADVFFFPSHYSCEASPIVLMEALGAGLPVVTTDWQGIPALVGDCEAVKLCPVRDAGEFADAILAFVRYRDALGELGRKAKAFFSTRFKPVHFIGRIEAGLSKAGL